MADQVVIANPVINSPFEEPKRHFRFNDEGITNQIGSFGNWRGSICERR
jgi:hypothetical protein